MGAARALMQASGTTGFSMRTLAQNAGVSIATPYNLFGSKQAVMIAILETELTAYREALGRVQGDELERLFNAVSIATELYADSPGFYRALLFSVYNDGGTEFRSMFSGSGHALWKGLVEEAIAAGHLSADVEPNAFAVNLGHIFFSCILEWVYGQLSLDELALRVQYGFALALAGMADQQSAARLRERAVSLQKRLRQLWISHAEANRPITRNRSVPA